jgi:hypothetical protein
MISLLAYVAAAPVMAANALAPSATALTPAGAEWTEIGSGLPRATPPSKSPAIDPATPSTLPLSIGMGRLFKRTAGGAGWR